MKSIFLKIAIIGILFIQACVASKDKKQGQTTDDMNRVIVENDKNTEQSGGDKSTVEFEGKGNTVYVKNKKVKNRSKNKRNKVIIKGDNNTVVFDNENVIDNSVDTQDTLIIEGSNQNIVYSNKNTYKSSRSPLRNYYSDEFLKDTLLLIPIKKVNAETKYQMGKYFLKERMARRYYSNGRKRVFNRHMAWELLWYSALTGCDSAYYTLAEIYYNGYLHKEDPGEQISSYFYRLSGIPTDHVLVESTATVLTEVKKEQQLLSNKLKPFSSLSNLQLWDIHQYYKAMYFDEQYIILPNQNWLTILEYRKRIVAELTKRGFDEKKLYEAFIRKR